MSLSEQINALAIRVAQEFGEKLDATKVGTNSIPVYIGDDGKAHQILSYAGNSATATKATQDNNGNEISTTYATKSEIENKVNAGDLMEVSNDEILGIVFDTLI